MTRMIVDCREVPSDISCTLAIAGEQDEVMRAATAHAIDVHGHTDDVELRDAIRQGMHESSEPAAPTSPGAFLQLIEFRTRHLDEFDATVARWAEAIGAARTARWGVTGTDRDQPDTYLQIVEFPDYAAAMANSEHPATGEFADRLAKLCEGAPGFRNLDVNRTETF
jgi:hypothetical protein